MEEEGARAPEGVIRGKPRDGPVSRYINRRISTRITRLIIAYRIPLTPNMVSAIAFTIALIAAPLYAIGHIVLAGILAQLSSIIDGVDGELARALGRASRRGGFLDTMLDRYADLALLLGATAYIIQHNPEPLWILAAALAISGDHLVSYIHTRAPHDFGIHPAEIGPLDSIASRDVRIFILFIGSIIGNLSYTLLAIAALSHTYVIAKTAAVLAHTKTTEEAGG